MNTTSSYAGQNDQESKHDSENINTSTTRTRRRLCFRILHEQLEERDAHSKRWRRKTRSNPGADTESDRTCGSIDGGAETNSESM